MNNELRDQFELRLNYSILNFHSKLEYRVVDPDDGFYPDGVYLDGVYPDGAYPEGDDNDDVVTSDKVGRNIVATLDAVRANSNKQNEGKSDLEATVNNLGTIGKCTRSFQRIVACRVCTINDAKF